MQQKFDSSTTDSKHKKQTKPEKGISKKTRESFPKPLPPKKTQSSLSNGGAISTSRARCSLQLEDPRASSCAAGCHAPAEEGERAVPHEARVPGVGAPCVAPVDLGGLIWMGSTNLDVDFFFKAGGTKMNPDERH